MKLTRTAQRCIFYGGVVALWAMGAWYATAMPGDSWVGPLPQASPQVREATNELTSHVAALAGTIGERQVGDAESLARAASYVKSQLEPITVPGESALSVEDLGAEGSRAENIVWELRGQSPTLVLVGAHYDSAPGTPGANDNASGVAVALYLAKQLASQRFRHRIRVVLFANEEPPYFQNPGMGSLAHARGCAERAEQIRAMLSLESLGYYSDAPNSQHYPWPIGLLYPDRGDFVGFVGNLSSRALVRDAIAIFRSVGNMPSEGAALPGWVPGVGWSDHWSFWQHGYPAIMVTDTALFRDSNYHQSGDVPEKLDYERMGRAAVALHQVIATLAQPIDKAEK